MKNLSRTPYIWGFLLACIVSLSNAQAGQNCEFQFMTASDVRQYFIQDTLINTEVSDKQTVSVTRSSNEALKFEKQPEASWFSSAGGAYDQNAAQGDLRWNIVIFFEQSLKALGIEPVSENRIDVLNTSELMKRLQKLSDELVKLGYEPIPVGYIKGSPSSHKEFVEIYLNSRSLPMADPMTEEQPFIHDYAFHLAAVLVPEEYYRSLDKMLHRLLDFGHWLKESGMNEVAQRVFSNGAQQLEIANAGVSVNWGLLKRDDQKEFSALSDDAKDQIGFQLSAITSLMTLSDEDKILYQRFLNEKGLEDINSPELNDISRFYEALETRRAQFEKAAGRLVQ